MNIVSIRYILGLEYRWYLKLFVLFLCIKSSRICNEDMFWRSLSHPSLLDIFYLQFNIFINILNFVIFSFIITNRWFDFFIRSSNVTMIKRDSIVVKYRRVILKQLIVNYMYYDVYNMILLSHKNHYLLK